MCNGRYFYGGDAKSYIKKISKIERAGEIVVSLSARA